VLITGQGSVGTASTVLFTEPPGPSVVTLSSGTASTGTAYIGAGSAVTTSNGAPLNPGGALTWATYEGSQGSPVSAVAAGSGVTVGWVISTAL
jgi:hypothetical protein